MSEELASDVEGWIRDSREEVCEAGIPVLGVRIGRDVERGAVFEEVLTMTFNTAALKEAFASPDCRSRTS